MGGNISKDSINSLVDQIPINLSTYHCAMLGLDQAGKTTVLYRLKLKQYVNSTTTIGFNCEKVRVNGSSFTIWDVGGQDKLRPLWKSYTRCTDAIVFVIDSCREDRLEEAKLELHKICRPSGPTSQNGSVKCQSQNSAIPVLVLANKQDLPSAVDVAKIEAGLGLKDLQNFGVQYCTQAVCAVTGDGLEEGFAKLTQLIARKRRAAKLPLPNGIKKSASSSRLLTSKKIGRSNSHVN